MLLNWTITEFEWYYMKIKLDFSNKLYLSPSLERNDFLNFTVNDTQYLSAISDDFRVAENYTLYTKLKPFLVEEEDKTFVQQVNIITTTSVLISLIVPLLFFLIMKSSMERIWSLYLTMQLIGNMNQLQNIHLPG